TLAYPVPPRAGVLAANRVWCRDQRFGKVHCPEESLQYIATAGHFGIVIDDTDRVAPEGFAIDAQKGLELRQPAVRPDIERTFRISRGFAARHFQYLLAIDFKIILAIAQRTDDCDREGPTAKHLTQLRQLGRAA